MTLHDAERWEAKKFVVVRARLMRRWNEEIAAADNEITSRGVRSGNSLLPIVGPLAKYLRELVDERLRLREEAVKMCPALASREQADALLDEIRCLIKATRQTFEDVCKQHERQTGAEAVRSAAAGMWREAARIEDEAHLEAAALALESSDGLPEGGSVREEPVTKPPAKSRSKLKGKLSAIERRVVEKIGRERLKTLSNTEICAAFGKDLRELAPTSQNARRLTLNRIRKKLGLPSSSETKKRS